MSNGEEEARRRKIIADQETATAALRGIRMVERGELTPGQVKAWTRLDEEYLEKLSGICPEAVR